jgi:hypothetical protein
MKIDHQIIHLALRGFLELLESTDKQATIETLELWLGQLTFLQHFIGDVPDAEGEYSAPTVRDDAHWRKLIGEQFPGLGDENLPRGIGNPVDDLAYIAREISECIQRWEKSGENNALWYFRFSYQAHWGTHLKNLQTYLHHLPVKERNKTARR